MRKFALFLSAAVCLAAAGATNVSPSVANDQEDVAAQTSDTKARAEGDLIAPVLRKIVDLDGFVAAGLNAGADRVWIRWKGQPPQEVAEIVSAARASGRPIDVIETKYDESDLRDHAYRLARLLDKRGVVITAWGEDASRGGIELRGPDLSRDRVPTTVVEMAKSQLPADLSLKLISESADLIAQPADSRHDDSGQPTPGNEIQVAGPGSCSSALGMRRSGTGHYLLTAAHCFDYSNGKTGTIPGNSRTGSSTGVPTLFGSRSTNSQSTPGIVLDAALLSTQGTIVESSLFTGTATGSAKTPVAGTTTIPYGVTMCASGAATGKHCNVVRSGGQIRACIDGTASNCQAWADIVEVSSNDGNIVFGQGDSGGAVYVETSDGALVAALIEGMVGGQSCGSLNYYGSGAFCTVDGGRVTSVKYIRDKLPDDFLVNTN